MSELIAELTFSREPITPVNQYKARAVKIGNKYTAMMYIDAKFRDYKAYVCEIAQQYATENKIEPYDGSVYVEAEFYMGTKRRKDLPNAGKLEFDALNGIIWEDDSQILKLTTEKRYDKQHPRTEIRIFKFNPSP